MALCGTSSGRPWPSRAAASRHRHSAANFGIDVRAVPERDRHRPRPGQGIGQGEPADEVLLRMLLRIRPRLALI